MARAEARARQALGRRAGGFLNVVMAAVAPRKCGQPGIGAGDQEPDGWDCTLDEEGNRRLDALDHAVGGGGVDDLGAVWRVGAAGDWALFRWSLGRHLTIPGAGLRAGDGRPANRARRAGAAAVGQ